VIALTVPWGAAQEALQNAGGLRGKILLDCTKPLKPDFSGLTHGFTTSGNEQVAARAPGSRVEKIFNTTGAGNMANHLYTEGVSMMLYCGDDSAAKNVAAQLATALGFEAYDVGPLQEARLLEPFALTWIHLAVFQKMGTNFAFRLMKRWAPPCDERCNFTPRGVLWVGIPTQRTVTAAPDRLVTCLFSVDNVQLSPGR
jgi:predicted dinucleotide-binding enzyme